MTQFYLEIAQGFMVKKQWSYAETALRRAIGFANKEGVAKGNIFRSLNAVRVMM